jgi:signal-transduction protein with cAMP-binding, CBS, and nucleotidyltransferase domain
MKVRDIIREKGSKVYSIEPNATVFEAIAEMADKSIGSLLVMEENQLRGIITERDYREKVILEGRTSKTTRVEEIMTSNVHCVDMEKSVEECMAVMTNRKFRHLPVMENNEIAGVISIGDLVKSIISKQKIEIENLTSYISGTYPG